jgi:hypothetical protein
MLNLWPSRPGVVRIISEVVLPAALTLVLYLGRLNDVSFIQGFLAFALLLISWRAYLRWQRSGDYAIPIFAMLSFMYWLYYAVPLFLEEPIVSTIYEPIGHDLTETAISKALIMALTGVCFLWLGMNSRIVQSFVPTNPKLSFELNNSTTRYVRAVLIVGSLLSLSDIPLFLLGEGSRQLISIVVSVVPLLAFALLFRQVIRGQADLIDRILVVGFLAVRFITGLSSGWLGVFASIVLICGAIYLAERRRLPRLVLVTVVLFTVFFQLGKEDFRKTYWQSDDPGQGGRVERVAFWIQASFEKWEEAINDSSGESLRRALNPSISRISLLNQTANVIEQTPSVVPYQNGQLYSYLIVTWIPRFVWPDKPSVNDSNRYYQVAYGLTAEDQLGTVSIAVGLLAEAFINFGWIGVVAIMFVVGVFFDFYQRIFLGKDSGVLMTAIGLIMLPQFLAIESQMAQYLGGILQQVLVTLVVMLPVVQIGSARRSLKLIPSKL